ncbi:hypothetical protein [Flavihumibacter petaseus]|uniref:Uncharacterized protein n=1 Tax=Flavihumibacter petaseus NBRC 106054 TaxID=1220578 RepID=A0A0E9MVX8_9BACT|nr:hypothetical protein [Flavihumibacter petaseus]GAO41576.1 hypothetical protein FPE01S_01_05900 [Flavihumibacter petaseus NBRC 106054]
MKKELPYAKAELNNAVITELEHPIHVMFHVSFPDGYENIFFTDPESGRWLEQDLGPTDLAEAIGQLTACQPDLEKSLRKLRWISEIQLGRNILFGFLQFNLSQFNAFEIYHANHRYLFTIVRINDALWQVFRPEKDADWNDKDDLLQWLPEILEAHSF